MKKPKRLIKNRPRTISRKFEAGPGEVHFSKRLRSDGLYVEKFYWCEAEGRVKTELVLSPERQAHLDSIRV